MNGVSHRVEPRQVYAVAPVDWLFSVHIVQAVRLLIYLLPYCPLIRVGTALPLNH